MHPRDADVLTSSYETAAGKARDALAALSPLMTEAYALLEMPGQNPAYGPMPALNTVANELTTDGRDLQWRVDWMRTIDAQPLGVSGQVQAYAPTTGGPNGGFDLDAALNASGLTVDEAERAKAAILGGADFSDTITAEKQRTFDQNMAAFRQMEAQSWEAQELTPIEQAEHSLDEIRDVLDTAKHDRGKGIGATQGDHIWSTEDLNVIIENKDGYYTPEQVEHARTVLAMAESSPDARDYLGITESGGGWDWSFIGHTVLDVVGMIPVVGEPADAINAAWYLAEGEYLDAALSSLALIPAIGAAVIGAKAAIKSAANGRVFKSLDEALAWAKRKLDEIIGWGDDAAGAAGVDSFNDLGQMQRSGDRLVVTQTGPTCGPNSCAMALDTAGYQIDKVDEFVSNFRIHSRGTDVVRMTDDLGDMGVQATPHLDLNVADIAARTRHGGPVIAHVRHPGPGGTGHFVVVDGVTKRNGKDVVAIRDPHGRQYFEELEVFEARFTGNGLTFEG